MALQRPEDSPFAAELAATARAISTPGKGILAADESTATIGRQFSAFGVANTHENRRAYRELLFSTPGLGQYLAGAICFEETLLDVCRDGHTRLVDLLHSQSILPGVKVDKGTSPLPGTLCETVTQGMDDLAERCRAYYEAGARFAKWRAVLRINDAGGATPSQLAISQNADALARYAVICQCNGLMPIVEPEVLMDGPHTLEMAAEATRKVMAAVYKSLHDHHAFLEGSVLMPSFVRSGDACLLEEAAPAGRVALATLTCLRRTVPPAVPAVAFLSGGMGEEEAALMLNEINRLAGSVGGMAPWSLTFSFGRALQQSCLAAWRGSEENVGAAQAELLLRSKCCSLANLGVYAGQGSRGARGAPDYFLPDELAAAARRLPVDLGGLRDKSSLPAL